MNKAIIKSAYAKITTDDHFREETISLMIQKQKEKERRQADKPNRKHLILASTIASLILAGVILAWQAIGGYVPFQAITTARSVLSTTAASMNINVTTSKITENNPTSIEQKIVVSDEYPDGLVDILRPKQGEIIITRAVQSALDDPKNASKYFFVHLYVIPTEQYSHDAKNYIYNGRTIAEWQVLLDLSKGTYPYSEYKGDHGGKVTIEEWKQKQEEAKTLAAQENLDAATEQYNITVRPMIEAAQVSSEQSEWARLIKLGYDVTLAQTWRYVNDSDKQVYTILTGLLSQKQIKEFPVNVSFGYLLDWVHNGDGIVTWDAGE